MRFVSILAAVLLVGCAALPERPANEDPLAAWEARQTALARLSAWELRGRLALRTEEEGIHASVYWRCDRDTLRIDLAGPFGGGRVRITQDEHGAELRDASNKIYRDASLQELLARVTGWRLPLESLRWWIVGIPAPDAAPRMELDGWGRLKTLEQSGWVVQFLEYTTHGAYELPRRVFIKRSSHAPYDALLEARFVVETWSLSESTPTAAAE